MLSKIKKPIKERIICHSQPEALNRRPATRDDIISLPAKRESRNKL
jgi:hypothetical protein